VIEQSLPAMLRQCANLEPDGMAYTFMDYGHDRAGIAETVTYSQLYRRTLNVARELKLCASTGERAVILAPQGLDYIYAFLGALQAGLIPVPLSVPQNGVTDERVDSVMLDASPSIVLTTSGVTGVVAQSVTSQSGAPAPTIIEVDRLDLESPVRFDAEPDSRQTAAYLQYTSGSTRAPAGVMVTYKNLLINCQQLSHGLLRGTDGKPAEGYFVSWLPFYHDMGLVCGICGPIVGGFPVMFTSPMAFLQRPVRWIQMMSIEVPTFSAAPNFAFEWAAAKTSDDDIAGLDLSRVFGILSGSERVNPATLKRLADRFARANLAPNVLRPGYGLAEATVYVTIAKAGEPPKVVNFESDKLSAGYAERCPATGGIPLVSYPLVPEPILRIVDPDTQTECPEGSLGEIWVHGDNVAVGYWNKPEETARTFGGRLVAPSAGTPEGPWLQTGDSGFISDGELFIIGRIKDLLIVYGKNHSPDDIEATIQEISGGRCAAIAVTAGDIEKLVVIVEARRRGPKEMQRLGAVRREVTSAISTTHGLSVSDLVLVSPGSIPITTSGKIRRAECVQLYRNDKFNRLDA
jgi:long-chain fatty acid adenylase/transferase FadD23